MNPRITRITLASLAAIALAPLAHADDPEKPLDLAGVWNAVASSEDAERSFTWTFAREGDILTGMSRNNENGEERKLDRVTVDGNRVVLEVDVARDGSTGVIRVEAEQTDRGKLDGSWILRGSDGTVYGEGAVSATREATVTYAGKWKGTATLPDGGEATASLMLEGDASHLTGSFTTEDGTVVAIEKATADGKGLRLQFSLVIEGTSVIGVVEASPEGANKLVGHWIIKDAEGGEAAKGAWTAVREAAPGLAGEWHVSATTPDGGTHASTLTLTRDGAGFTGKSKSNEGAEVDLTTVAVDGKRLVLTLKMERDGQSGTITVKAEQQEDGSLDGKWSLSDQEGVEVAGDHWKATRS